MNKPIVIRELGLQDYEPVWRAMQEFTADRKDTTLDELWCLEHTPVFTMGLNGNKEHLLNVSDIPVIDIDRGGQVTYHGPGQLLIYTLLDLKRLGLSVKTLVRQIEQSIINLLAEYHVDAKGDDNAPGVYVEGKKIAALGLRIKKNRSYHGLSLNIDMDLSPFKQINPCGYEGLDVIQVSDLVQSADMNSIKSKLIQHLTGLLGYNNLSYVSSLP